MPVELTSPAFGKAAGETYSGDHEEWLVFQGYAKRTGGALEDLLRVTDVEADKDPTLAANREAPDEGPPTTEDPSDDPTKAKAAVQDKARTVQEVEEANKADADRRREESKAGSAAVTKDDRARAKHQARANKAAEKGLEEQAEVHREAHKATVEGDTERPTLTR